MNLLKTLIKKYHAWRCENGHHKIDVVCEYDQCWADSQHCKHCGEID